MTKVVHLITLLELGGAQGNTLHTVMNLDPKKFQAHLWCGKGAYWDQEAENKLRSEDRFRFIKHLVRPIHPWHDFLAIWELAEHLRRLKPQILHTHSSKAGIVGRIAGRMAGVPVIIHTYHGFGFNEEQKPWVKWGFIWLERLCARFSHKLIFVSKSNQQTARAYGIGKEFQYELIRSGVPVAEIEKRARQASRQELRQSLGLPPESRVVTTIGPFKPQKNLEDFISLAGRVASQRPDTVFLMIGDGALRQAFEQRRDQEKLQSKLFMPGWRRDVAECLAASDVFVLTSLWEGLPRSLVEAMIAGVPSVCYATDGVKDLLNVETGALVPQKDVPAAGEAVIRLLTHPDEARKMASRAHALIGKEFDIDHMVRQQEALYESLLV